MNTFSADFIRKSDFRVNAHTTALLRNSWREYVDTIPPYPGKFNGKGIVICAGGITHLTCAWVNISVLRMNGCTLPIEIWYTGNELNAEAIAAFSQLGAECRNSKDYTDKDVRQLVLKPFAILNSSFKEVLYLDADNNCVADPTYLFDDISYKAAGTIFWPDFWTTDRNNPIWEIIGTDEYQSIEQESGQILINKETCWKELNLCMYFNLKNEYYYKMLLGDKDTFRFAWLALGRQYNMITSHVGSCGFEGPTKDFYGLTMVQHDAAANILFLHRNWLKWDVTKEDEPVWIKIKRFRADAKDRTCRSNYATIGGIRCSFWDLLGDVEYLDFQEMFGNYELKCLEILKTLRNYKFYARFLLHNHFLQYRPGYSLGFTDKIYFDQPEVLNT